jgi:hypothetical protein
MNAFFDVDLRWLKIPPEPQKLVVVFQPLRDML